MIGGNRGTCNSDERESQAEDDTCFSIYCHEQRSHCGCDALSVLNGSMRTVATASEYVTYVIPMLLVWYVYRSSVNLTFKKYFTDKS